jgi:hypothetical protein
MAYNDNSCAANKGNTGLSQCLDELGYDYKLIHTPLTYEIADEATALLEATWQDDIDAKNIHPFPAFEEVEATSEDDVEQELNTGNSIHVREGKYSGIGKLRVPMCNLSALRTFNGVKGRVFIVTSNGKIFGTSPDGTKFKGFELSKLRVSYTKGTDGTNARMVDIRYQLQNPTEMGDYPAIPNITAWNPTTLTGLISATVSVSSSAAGSVTISVASDCDGESIEDLVVGDFTMLASDGTTEKLPGDTVDPDNGDGTYTFLFTGPALPADTYTVNLKAASASTTGQYDPGTAASFTIS